MLKCRKKNIKHLFRCPIDWANVSESQTESSEPMNTKRTDGAESDSKPSITFN